MISQLLLALQIAVGVIFAASALAKAVRPREFFDALAEYGIERTAISVPVGSALILLEGIVALTHVTGWMLLWGMAAALCLLSGFVFVIALALVRGTTVACLCFGTRSGETASKRTLVRLLLLLASEILVASLWLGSKEVAWTLPYRLAADETLLAFAGATAIVLAATWLVELTDVIPRIAKSLASRRKPVRS